MIATQTSFANSAAALATSFAGSNRLPVYFVMDFFNVSIGANELAKERGLPGACQRATRLHCRHFREFVQRDREWGGGFAAGAFRSPQPRLTKRYKDAGIKLEVYESGCRTGTEQGVDKVLQNALHRFSREPVGVIALATGDGNGHEVGEGFLPELKDLYTKGFDIEVMSWSHCLNQELRRWTEAHGTVIELDNWFNQLTFDDCRRSAMRLVDVRGKLNRQLAVKTVR